MLKALPILTACLLLTSVHVAETFAEQGPSDPLNALEWREIGPWRGGRVTTVAGVPGQPNLYYMGATGGGVWKTINAGATWQNISDGHFMVGTIGAVAVAPSDPNVLYVGTGESPIRGVTTSHGDGVWKSTDAGETWEHIGLPDAGQIGRIMIHPDDPDTAWVAVQGQIWGPSEQRGVFKTTDGGATWQHVLKVNPDTGAVDLAMVPNQPDVLYAALWHHGRNPWFVKSGGAGGGIYKSTDGGDSWEKLGGGLPQLVGKAGVDIAASNPSVVWAIVEAPYEEAGLYRSGDAGETWERVNERRVLHARPWYYMHITVDPTDENTVWVLNVPLMKSTDGGKTFEKVKTPHGDHHDHWINPDNPLNMINGNDGGATITFDGGETWSSIYNQPTAQFYRVVTDRQQPFRIYGGQQDNSTVAIASASRRGGIGVEDYYPVGGGESAHIAFDPDDPRLVYATSINNTLTEYDHETGRIRSIKPYPEHVFGMDARDLRYRTNWNSPLAASPHDWSVIYYGAQVLLMSSDRGHTWTEISPDLTRNDPEKQGRNGGPITPENVGAEFYNTIFYIVESPLEKGAIWVGSDDGLVHLTRNGGKDWTDVTPPGTPEGMVNSIELSPHDAGTAYFALARYKLNDFRPYIYMTGDHGRSWRRIDAGLPQDTFVRVVREDPQQAGVLYAGTEAGMFLSYDGGENWRSMRMNLPPVPITDLAINGHSLVAATQGRGFWVFDDLRIVRQMETDFSNSNLHALDPSPTRLGDHYGSAGDFEGANPPEGTVLYYFIGEDVEGPLQIDILDESGMLIRSFSSEETDFDRCVLANEDLRRPVELEYPGVEPGLNRWEWDLRGLPLKCIPEARNYVGFDGLPVAPGRYQAQFRIGGEEQTVAIEVQPDPLIQASATAIAEWRASMEDLAALFNEIETNIDNVRALRREIRSRIEGQPVDADVLEAGKARLAFLDDWESRVTQLLFDTYEDEDSWPVLIDGQVRNLLSYVESAGPPVTPGTLERKGDVEKIWAGFRGELEALEETGLSMPE